MIEGLKEGIWKVILEIFCERDMGVKVEGDRAGKGI